MKDWINGMKDWMRAKIGKPWARIKPIKPIALPKKKRRKNKTSLLQIERGRAEVLCLTYLKVFWPRFSAAVSDSERLGLLKAAAKDPGWERVSEDLRKYLRQKFTKMGFRLLDVPVDKCGVCDNPPKEKHHIVPLYFGGINANDNLIMICCECHNAIHPWMVRK